MSACDVLVIGGGVAGSAISRLCADAGKRVLLLERQSHIGGTAYDCTDSAGILVHRYGPHIFHTNDETAYTFLSRFTAWNGYAHKVAANVDGLLMPVPFNLDSLEIAFGGRAPMLREKLEARYRSGQKVSILELREISDPDLAELADYIYRNIFLNYTVKQWGCTPEEIDPAAISRVPVSVSRECGYFGDVWQGLPTNGYAAMFGNMLDHPNIQLRLGADAACHMRMEDGGILLDDEPFYGPVVYTGALDELFENRYGRLPYRTLDFCFETHPVSFFQSHAVVNYTLKEPYTRITEFKRMTLQNLPEFTTICREFSKAYTGAEGEIPFYPIANPESGKLYNRYTGLAGRWRNLYLLGRLAEFKYYNMDAVTIRALALFRQLKEEWF